MIPNRPRLYLASPLSSQHERGRNAQLRDMLLSSCDVYLPQEDGFLLTSLADSGMPVSRAKKIVYDNDIQAIHAADILLIVMDGRSVDEGACFELGYARALGKICVGLKTDSRSLLTLGDNPMLEMALDFRFENEKSLSEWLYKFCELIYANPKERDVRQTPTPP